jgi:hypothetical protein
MLGLKQEINRRKFQHFSEAEKRIIIEDNLQRGLSKKDILEKYTGRREEHGLILYWMYKYGYHSDSSKKTVTFAPKTTSMKIFIFCIK